MLEIVNGAKGRTVIITFDTVSWPTGITMYISSSVNTTLSYSVSNGVISIPNGNPVTTASSVYTLSYGTYYIGFLFGSSPSSGTGTIAFHYQIS